MKSFFTFLVYVFLWVAQMSAQEVAPHSIQLQGYLGKNEMVKAQQELTKASGEGPLILEINSNAGDIDQVLSFAKALYLTKLDTKRQVIVYIDDKALGPAALIPFLADKIFTSRVASWGDIPLGNEDIVPANILRSQLTSLLPKESPRLSLLKTLATGMSDKGAISQELQSLGKGEDEALVLNQQQMQALSLSEEPLSLAQFRKNWQLDLDVAPAVIPSDKALLAKNVMEKLKRHIPFDSDGPNTIGHLIIEDHSSSINQATWLYIKNGLEYYKKNKPLFIILELNTPGGEVFAAQKISDALKDFDTQYNIPIVCYINNWAISAGAMLAYSCRFIAVTKDGTMGAAEPVIMGEGNETKPASEKITSAIRTDFASRARFFDRNPNIAEAMVDKDAILVVRHGEVISLNNESQIQSKGSDPDILLSPKGKLLTLNAEQMLNYGVADLLLFPQKTGQISLAEQEKGQWPASKMLLFHAPFFDQIPEATIDSYQMDWKSKFFSYLASPMVSSLLLLGLILGFYMELSTPGFGIPGALGVICLVLIVLSSFSLEIASWLEVILLFTGLTILLVDLFILPTFGLLGVAGIVFFLMGLFGLLLPGLESVEYEFDTHTFNAAGQLVLDRIVWYSLTLLLGGALILLLARYFTPKLAAYTSLVLTGNEQEANKGFIAGENPKLLPSVGSQGEVLATLRPSGKVFINNTVHEALSPGKFIEKGEKIQVVRLEGGVIIVDRLTNEEPA